MQFPQYTHLISVTSFVVAIVASVTVPTSAQARTVVWTGTDTVNLANSVLPNYKGSDIWYVPLINPSVTVRYGADATDTATGLSVCDSIVTEGATINVRFAPYVPEDVVWNVTGGHWDTPYGRWSPNAAIPDVACRDTDQISSFSTTMWGSIQLFAPFMANPPSRSLNVQNGLLSCDTSTVESTGVATCRATATGNAGLEFDFGPTYGKFYFRSRHTKGFDPAGKPAPACTGYLPSGFYLPNQSNTGKNYLELFSAGEYEPMRRAPGTFTPSTSLGKDSFKGGYTSYKPSTSSNFAAAVNEAAPYQVNVPAQSITCPITVVARAGGVLLAHGQCKLVRCGNRGCNHYAFGRSRR